MIKLHDLVGREDAWGRAMGREVFARLLAEVERRPDEAVIGISLKGVRRLDVSFSSESIVELARRYRGSKGFYLTDVADGDLEENIDAAAKRIDQPIVVRDGKSPRYIGALPSPGVKDALDFVVERVQARAAEFATAKSMSIANASNKFKQLWNHGFLLRRESAADSGGVEFVYHRIG